MRPVEEEAVNRVRGNSRGGRPFDPEQIGDTRRETHIGTKISHTFIGERLE